MRLVPVSTWVPFSVQLRKAVMKRMAVPAALMSITSGMSFMARRMTSVSSQLLIFSKLTPPFCKA